ncbi:MAG TPA: tetratricopeptide repeat protein [Ignavibacteria bacterium]
MDILKTKRILALIIIAIIFVSQINAQTLSGQGNAPNDDIRSAFKESYRLESKGKVQSAIDVLRKVYSKSSYELNLRLGYLSNLKGLYSDAIYFYNTAIGIMPLSVEARLGLANPVIAIEDWTTLENTYNDILKIDPNNSQVNYKLGMMFYYRADYNGAAKYIEKTVNMYPFDYYSVLMLGWTYYNLGKTREAEVLFNKVLLIAPDDASALEGLGLINKK